MRTKLMLFLMAGVVAASFFGALPAQAKSDEFLKETRVDLTGNGRFNHVFFKELGIAGKYRLTIDGVGVTDRLVEGLRGFKVLDLNTADHRKEIGVYTDGYDGGTWAIYTFRNHRIRLVGRISPFVALGNGNLIASELRQDSFTWHLRQKYIFNSRSQLVKVPQDLYTVFSSGSIQKGEVLRERPVAVVKPFSLLKDRTGKSVIATVRKGSKVSVLLWGGDDWFAVETEQGLVGWTTSKTLDQHTRDLPKAG